jgi:SAM-dependent methyltransferase
MELKRRLLRDPLRVFIPYNETTERWDDSLDPNQKEEKPAAKPAPVPATPQRKLHLGCGTNVLEGYINIDAYTNGPGIVDRDIRKLIYENNSQDEVLAEDVLEHFGRNEWRDVLKEWIRVLKPGGKIIIRVPDMVKLCKELISSNTEPELWEKWNRRIFGDQGAEGMTHFTGFGHPYFQYVMERDYGMIMDDKSESNFNLTYTFHKPSDLKN